MNNDKSNFRHALFLFLIAPLISLFGPQVAAAAKTEKAELPVVGWVEKAIVIPLGVTVKIKMDTGALTSSMDAKNIETFKKEGRNWVRFRLHLTDEKTGEDLYRDMEMRVKRFVRLRGAGGMDRRPVVVLPLCIGSKIYEESFTLRDRDNMLYPVLIGRRTLEELGMVDVRRTFVTQPTCDVDVNADVVEAPASEK